MAGTTAGDRKELAEFILAQMVARMTETSTAVSEKRVTKNHV